MRSQSFISFLYICSCLLWQTTNSYFSDVIFLRVCEKSGPAVAIADKHQTSSVVRSERLHDLPTWVSRERTPAGDWKKEARLAWVVMTISTPGSCACALEGECLKVSRAVRKEASGHPGKQNAQKGICRVAALP